MIMRSVIGSLVLFSATFIALPGAAQERDSTRYIVPKHMRVSGMGGLLINWGTVNFGNSARTIAGGGGGVLLDQHLMIGGYGMGAPERAVQTDLVRDGLTWRGTLKFEHAGLWTVWSFNHRRPIHPFVSLQLGWGEASWEFADTYGNIPANGNGSVQPPRTDADRIFVLTPSAGAEFNVFPWFRPNLSVGYRAVTGLALGDTRTSDLNGVFVALNLLFGGFGDDE